MKKKFKSLLCILLCVFAVLTTLNVKADSGWDSSYDSGGSSWSSSDSSWSSSDSSWGSSSDYSSSYSGEADAGDVLFIVLAIFIFAIFIIAYGSKETSKATRSYRYNDISLEELQKYLPDKTLEQVKKDVFARFVNIQEAWMNFDYDALREYCTDELYNTYVSQLETLKLKNGQNIMSDYQNLDMKITNITSENNVVSLIVYAEIRFHDYVINMKTNEVIRGTKERLMTNHYLMTFVIKKSDAKSLKICPSCGAPFEHNASGVCEYCGSTIIKEADEFVLSKKTNINR